MQQNLRKTTLNALLWSFIERSGYQIIQFFVSIIIARILLPEEFGLIAMLSIFIAIGHSFINSGFGQALIQKQNTTFIDECSIFYFNITIAFLFTSILFFTAPLIARFYNQEQLLPIARVLSFVFIFNALGLIQRTLIAKELAFKILIKVSLLATSISGIVAIIMASKGFGVWSLVAMMFSNEALNTLFLWVLRPWRPGLVFSLTSLKSMFRFGSRLFAVSITNAIFINIYKLVIGKFFTPANLGFYSRADSLSKYPVNLINSIVGQVVFPLFSKIQNDKHRLKRIIQKSLIFISLLTFPLMMGIAATAEPLIKILLTEKWIESVPYFQLLCFIGMLIPIQALNLNSVNAQGRSDLHLKVDIINKSLTILLILLTYKIGIMAMIIGQIINSIVAYFLYSFYNGKLLNYGFKNQLFDLMPVFLISLFMAFFVYSLNFLTIFSTLSLLLLQGFSGVLLYTLLLYLLRRKLFNEFVVLIKEYSQVSPKNKK